MTASSARSMAARSSAQPTIGSASVVDDVEAPVFTLGQPAYRSLDLFQLFVSATQQFDTLVEQDERPGEVELRVAKLGDDRLQAGHLLLERHRSSRALSRIESTVATTVPSLKSSSKSISGVK